MDMKTVLEQLAQGLDMTGEMADYAFGLMMGGEMPESVAGAFLMGLRAKGETAPELAAGVRAALGKARLVEGIEGQSIDTCGTGGDCTNSFNCSTILALLLADMGHQVVKHGNRAVSSSCGSADVVEALGLPFGVGPDVALDELRKRNFVFLFAPAYHPAFAHVVPIRKNMAIRTIFNLMGPLLNPARPTHQILGVPNEEFGRLMAEALSMTGVRKAAVVHGSGGFDELTTFGPAVVFMVEPGKVERMDFDPKALGFEAHAPEDVAVRDKEEAVGVVREILSGGGPRAMKDMVAVNMAMALHLLEGLDMAACVEKARDKVNAGITGSVLDA